MITERLGQGGNVSRGRRQDEETRQAITKRENARRFNQQLNDLINTINQMTGDSSWEKH